jgi:two-component system sensor histidine kinase RpfC
VLDPSHLNRLRQLDEQDDFLHGLIQDFIADGEQLVDELEAAALERDAATFRDRAHALRGSAAHIGATALFELCLEWRGIGPDDLATEGADYATFLRSEFERLRLALTAEMTRPQPNGQAASSSPH